MKKTATVALLLALSLSAAAQDQTIKGLQSEAGKTIKKDAADTSAKTWKNGGLFSFNIGRAH